MGLNGAHPFLQIAISEILTRFVSTSVHITVKMFSLCCLHLQKWSICDYFEKEWSTMFAFFLQLLTIDWWNHLNQVHVVSCARLAVHCAAVWQQSRTTDARKGFFHTYLRNSGRLGRLGKNECIEDHFVWRTISTNIVQAFALISHFFLQKDKLFIHFKEYILRFGVWV